MNFIQVIIKRLKTPKLCPICKRPRKGNIFKGYYYPCDKLAPGFHY